MVGDNKWMDTRMRTIILFILSATLLFPQGITDKHKSVIARINAATGGTPPAAPDTGYFNASAEWGGTGIFGGTYSTGGTFTVQAGAKLHGDYGYQALLDGTAGNNFVGAYKNLTATDSCYVRFYVYIDPSFEATADNDFRMLSVNNSGTVIGDIQIVLDGSGHPFEWLSTWRTGGDSTTTTNFSTGAWHEIQIYYKIGTGSDAKFKIWIDGDVIVNAADCSSTYQFNRIYVGILYTDTGVDGSYLNYDDLVISDTYINSYP